MRKRKCEEYGNLIRGTYCEISDKIKKYTKYNVMIRKSTNYIQ